MSISVRKSSGVQRKAVNTSGKTHQQTQLKLIANAAINIASAAIDHLISPSVVLYYRDGLKRLNQARKKK